MMKHRLLTYCILLVFCFIDVKVMASNEVPDFLSLLSYISTENSKQADARMQLKGTDVEVNINGSIAEVTVKQQYKNNSDQILSGWYNFSAPEKALVHDMEMKTNENIFTAKVKEQKTAEKEFNRYREEGKNALLLKQEKPNLLSMDLANVMPGETVDIELSYTELLTPADMKYQFVYPAMSDTVFKDQPEFNITVNISAGIPIQELMCSTHETDIVIDNESSAKVILKNQGKTGNNRDYVLNYRLAEQKNPSGLILSGGKGENYLLLNQYVGMPGLKDISVKFTDLKTYDLEPSDIPELSARKPLTVLAKWDGEADGLIKVNGRMNRRNYTKTYRFVKNNSRKSNGSLEYLWAGKRLERLSNLDAENEDTDLNSEITDLGLKHNVLTPKTSLLAFNDVVRKKVEPVEMIQDSLPPLHPEEEESYSEAEMIAKVPEPGFYVLLLILTSVVAAGGVRRKAVKIISRRAVAETDK